MLRKVFRSYSSRFGARNAKPDPGRLLDQARARIEQGRPDEAIALINQALGMDATAAEAYLLRIEAFLMSGRDDPANEDRMRVCGLVSPRHAAEMFHAAATDLWRWGHQDGALRTFSWALISDPECDQGAELPGVDVHGEWYLNQIERIHSHLRPRTYLEIGVAGGDSICKALPDTLAIGVDPKPSPTIPAAPNRQIFAQTSDAFFAGQDVRALFGGLPVELAFIDGMHQFEFSLRDFMNVERLCTPASTVLVHDCYPATRTSAERERRTHFWSGDIWKLLLLLKKYRPDLSVHTIAAPPTGLALIRGLDPASPVIAEHLDALVEEYLALDYSVLDDDKRGSLNLVPNDWDAICSLLGAANHGDLQ